jgi:hypothetical protein
MKPTINQIRQAIIDGEDHIQNILIPKAINPSEGSKSESKYFENLYIETPENLYKKEFSLFDFICIDPASFMQMCSPNNMFELPNLKVKQFTFFDVVGNSLLPFFIELLNSNKIQDCFQNKIPGGFKIQWHNSDSFLETFYLEVLPNNDEYQILAVHTNTENPNNDLFFTSLINCSVNLSCKDYGALHKTVHIIKKLKKSLLEALSKSS